MPTANRGLRTFAIFLATCSAALAGAVAAAATAPPGEGTLLVGAASRSVLPLVDGSHDYLEAPLPGRQDRTDPGILVPNWDDGRIAVGNGQPVSYWVRDDLRATAVAIEDPRSPHILVIVATDLYMVFRQDGDAIRAKAAQRLPPGLAKKLKVIVSATHNHHGPDTAFDVNHAWYEHMSDQVAATIVEAVENRRPARLKVAAGTHWFGMNDGTDPQVFDPALNVMQAVDTRGEVVATLVQWNLHPEGTLNYSPPLSAIEADCAVLGLSGSACTARGRYFTADFPGILREDLQARYGGEVAFLNGALGVLIGPGGADVWEVTPQHPLGNQLRAPAGAVGPGGAVGGYTERNFRRTVIIGEQLAAAAIRLLDSAQKIADPRTSYAVQPFFTYLSNFGFRVLLTVNPDTGRTDLGHVVPMLYNCPLGGPKNGATCTPDDYQSSTDPNIEVQFRNGDHLKSAVEYVKIGPVGMMFLPGEIPGELTAGLPAGFRTNPQLWYEDDPAMQAFGAAYRIPGYTLRRMADGYKWTVGLGSDQIGYFVPLSNYRVYCVADGFVGPGTCAALHAGGIIEFPDAVAGATCKRITENPALIGGYPAPYGQLVAASCRYGQAFGEAEDHYEETNSAGWDIVEDMMRAVGDLTGNHDPTEVNPNFPGWWEGNLPPGDLP
jgi:hypothetical protein